MHILPNEGATSGRQLYRDAQLMLAMEEMKKKNYQKALDYITAARQWPQSLGVGKPYATDIDERLEDWLAYEAYTRLGDTGSARKMLSKIESFTPLNEEGNVYQSANDLITAWALQKLEKSQQGEKRLQEWLDKEPKSLVAQWVMNVYNKKRSAVTHEAITDEKYQLLAHWLHVAQ
jgi:tetratricopeptide (TPR) repeat protein